MSKRRAVQAKPLPSTPKGEGLKHIVAVSLLMLAFPLAAQTTPLAPLAHEQLADPAKEAAATQLMETLRCIQCQGQSIADSDAPIAGAMRAEVRARIDQGEDAQSIRDLMIARYGEWVSFEPRADLGGLLLWLAPLIILAIAIWSVRGLFRKPKS
jgi:cytochrome c-type biogenesis protein CcmH/NrfF